jgi:hypothetical protein
MTDPDERVRAYLRARADVPVPGDLRLPSVADDRRPVARLAWLGGGAVLAAAVVVSALVVGGSLMRGPSPDGAGPGPAASASPTAATTPGAAAFPASVAGMPVLSVADAAALLEAGELDGRAVAVAGYYFNVAMSCPAPGGYIGPLEDWCRVVAFAGDAAGATMCTYGENSMECHDPPSGLRLEPWLMPETSGEYPNMERAPVPLVLVGHADDARQWQCSAETQAECADAFVVDRVAWANGKELPLTAPGAWERTAWEPLVPQRSLSKVASALGEGTEVIAIAPFQAGDISMVDPRWNLAGDGLVWIVRSIGSSGAGNEPTRAVMVSLVDDETGDIIDAHDLALDGGYRPARLWTVATRRGHECCADEVYPFYRVERVGGLTVHDGLIQGSASGDGTGTTYGPGTPLVLEAGTYAVSSWLATLDPDAVRPSADACETEITLAEGDDLMLDAVFAAPGQACAFGEPTPPKLTWF